MFLVYLAAAWALGIAVASQTTVPLMLWLWWLVLPLGLLALWRRDANLRRAHILLLVFLLAALRYTVALPPAEWSPADLAHYNDSDSMLIIGNVVDAPEVRDRNVHIRLAVTRVRVENVWRDVAGLALVQAPRETDVRYGDQLQVFGEPQTPPVFEDFSYKEYLARQGIHSLVRVYGGVKILAREQGNPFFAALYAFRDRAHQTILKIFPEPVASLLAGILLGIDKGISKEVNDAFSATNTAHIVAISGFNISIIAGLLATLARRIVGAKRATLLVILGLAAYTLLVGASASVVRAAIMGSLSVVALHYHRQNDATNALSAAALVMLAWNPFTLFDVGFQLSFLATLGLVLYVNPLSLAFENFFARFTSNETAQHIVGALNDSFIVTLAAQITTTPLIVYIFHRLSLVGLLTNLIVLPVQPQVMLFGGAAVIAGMIFLPLGQLVGWVAWAFTAFTIAVVQFTARLPLSAIDTGRFEIWILVVYYFVLAGFTLLLPAAQNRTALKEHRADGFQFTPAILSGCALVIGMWVWSFAGTLPDGKTHVAFLDAGGAATFVRTPSGARVLINGGANPSATLSALGQRMPFWDNVIDVLVLTDTDDEHLAGAVAALERYNVRQIIQIDANAKSAAYQKWRDLIAEKNVPSVSAQADLQIQLDRAVTLEMLTPSLVRLRAGSATFLFADSLRADDDLPAEIASTVLVAPLKTNAELVEAASPQFAVMFAGTSERDKPSAETLNVLANVELLRTDERGTIEMIIDGTLLTIR